MNFRPRRHVQKLGRATFKQHAVVDRRTLSATAVPLVPKLKRWFKSEFISPVLGASGRNAGTIWYYLSVPDVPELPFLLPAVPQYH